MAWDQTWFDPFGNDHAIQGLWQRKRIVFPWKSGKRQGHRPFTGGCIF